MVQDYKGGTQMETPAMQTYWEIFRVCNELRLNYDQAFDAGLITELEHRRQLMIADLLAGEKRRG